MINPYPRYNKYHYPHFHHFWSPIYPRPLVHQHRRSRPQVDCILGDSLDQL